MAFPKLNSTTSLSLVAVVVLGFGLVIAVVGSQQQQDNRSKASGPATQTCTYVSDTSNTVTGGGNAVAAYVYPDWIASIPGATWIWKTHTVANPSTTEIYTFNKTFYLTLPVTSATIAISSDNKHEVLMNGTSYFSGDSNWVTPANYNFPTTANFKDGLNTLSVIGTNWGLPTTAELNPAAILYKFTVTAAYCNTVPPPPPTDTTPPSVPLGLTATAFSSSQINLSWSASTDNVGISAYIIYRNGTEIGRSLTTTYQDTGLTPSTLYKYTVSAIDGAGNKSAKSNEATATTQAPPTVNTKLKFDIQMHGIGNAGDSANPTGGGGNSNLVHLQRVLRVEILDGNDAVIASNPNGLVLFDTQSGSFKGTIDMGDQIPASGTYGVRVKMAQSLKKLKIQAITVGTTNTIPQITLVNGDVNDDNSVSINVADYNTLLGCYSDFTPAVDCDPTRKTKADLNDDGSVNFSDLNLFLRELNTSTGQ